MDTNFDYINVSSDMISTFYIKLLKYIYRILYISLSTHDNYIYTHIYTRLYLGGGAAV